MLDVVSIGLSQLTLVKEHAQLGLASAEAWNRLRDFPQAVKGVNEGPSVC
jgi:hypothetical protein